VLKRDASEGVQEKSRSFLGPCRRSGPIPGLMSRTSPERMILTERHLSSLLISCLPDSFRFGDAGLPGTGAIAPNRAGHTPVAELTCVAPCCRILRVIKPAAVSVRREVLRHGHRHCTPFSDSFR
jgi:hypothetical protein